MTGTGRHTAVFASALVVLALSSASASTVVPPAAVQTCSAPSELIQLEQLLVRTATRIAEGEPIRIVALGSSSTQDLVRVQFPRAIQAGLSSSCAHSYPGATLL